MDTFSSYRLVSGQGTAMNMIRTIPTLLLAACIAGCSTVHIDWDTANALNTIEGYEEFLQKHPDSEFTEEALQRVEPMRYQKAMDEGTTKGLTLYLLRYPNGRYASVVRSRIKDLRCQDPALRKKDYPSWLRIGSASDRLHRSSWYLDRSYVGKDPANIGRGFRASYDDPAFPLDLAWDKDHLVYFGGRGVIVGPDGTAVLVGYDCR